MQLASMDSTVEYLEPLMKDVAGMTCRRRQRRCSSRACRSRLAPPRRSLRLMAIRRLVGNDSCYDTIIIGAGMSGLAAGIRLAYYDQRVCILERHTTIGGLNSFYRLRRPQLRRRPARRHELHAQGHASKGPLARLLRQLRFAGKISRLSPQLGSAIAFPGVRAAIQQRLRVLAVRSATARFPREKDNFQRLLRRDRRLRRSERARLPTSRPVRSSVRSSAIRCWSRCCSAR